MPIRQTFCLDKVEPSRWSFILSWEHFVYMWTSFVLYSLLFPRAYFIGPSRKFKRTTITCVARKILHYPNCWTQLPNMASILLKNEICIINHPPKDLKTWAIVMILWNHKKAMKICILIGLKQQICKIITSAKLYHCTLATSLLIITWIVDLLKISKIFFSKKKIIFWRKIKNILKYEIN